MPITPALFPQSSLKYQYDQRRIVNLIHERYKSANPKPTLEKLQAELMPSLRFTLHGSDFMADRALVDDHIERKSLLSAKIGGLVAQISKISPNSRIEGSRAAIRELAEKYGLIGFVDRFEAANPQSFDGNRNLVIPSVFYQYALLRELNLIKGQVIMLEKNDRKFLTRPYEQTPEVINNAFENRRKGFQEILFPTEYPATEFVKQVHALIKNGQLNAAEADPCVRALSSSMGVVIDGTISTEQLSGYENYDRAIFKRFIALLEEASNNLQGDQASLIQMEGALVEIMMKTGGGKSHMTREVIRAYSGIKERLNIDDLLAGFPEANKTRLKRAYNSIKDSIDLIKDIRTINLNPAEENLWILDPNITEGELRVLEQIAAERNARIEEELATLREQGEATEALEARREELFAANPLPKAKDEVVVQRVSQLKEGLSEEEIRVLDLPRDLGGVILQLDEAYFYGDSTEILQDRIIQVLVEHGKITQAEAEAAQSDLDKQNLILKNAEAVDIEEARNDLINGLIERGAVCVTLGASESLAKVKADIYELDDAIIAEEERVIRESESLKSQGYNPNIAKVAVESFKKTKGYEDQSNWDNITKPRYEKAAKIFDELRELADMADERNPVSLRENLYKFLEEKSLYKDKAKEALAALDANTMPVEVLTNYEKASFEKLEDWVRGTPVNTRNRKGSRNGGMSSQNFQGEKEIVKAFNAIEGCYTGTKKRNLLLEGTGLLAKVREFEKLASGSPTVSEKSASHWGQGSAVTKLSLVKSAIGIAAAMKAMKPSSEEAAREIEEKLRILSELLRVGGVDIDSPNFLLSNYSLIKPKQTPLVRQSQIDPVASSLASFNASEIYSTVLDVMASPNIFFDFDPPAESPEVTEMKKQRSIKKAQYHDLAKRREGEVVDGEVIEGRTKRRFLSAYDAGRMLQHQGNYLGKNLSDLVLEHLPELSVSRDGIGGKVQYILPHLKINRENCATHDLEAIQRKTKADIIILPDRTKGRELRCRVYYQNSDRQFVTEWMELGDVPERKVLGKKYLSEFLAEQNVGSKKVLSFFDKTNYIGGDYDKAGVGVLDQIIHVDDALDKRMNWNRKMQANRNRGMVADDLPDRVKYKFVYHRLGKETSPRGFDVHGDARRPASAANKKSSGRSESPLKSAMSFSGLESLTSQKSIRTIGSDPELETIRLENVKDMIMRSLDHNTVQDDKDHVIGALRSKRKVARRRDNERDANKFHDYETGNIWEKPFQMEEREKAKLQVDAQGVVTEIPDAISDDVSLVEASRSNSKVMLEQASIIASAAVGRTMGASKSTPVLANKVVNSIQQAGIPVASSMNRNSSVGTIAPIDRVRTDDPEMQAILGEIYNYSAELVQYLGGINVESGIQNMGDVKFKFSTEYDISKHEVLILTEATTRQTPKVCSILRSELNGNFSITRGSDRQNHQLLLIDSAQDLKDIRDAIKKKIYEKKSHKLDEMLKELDRYYDKEEYQINYTSLDKAATTGKSLATGDTGVALLKLAGVDYDIRFHSSQTDKGTKDARLSDAMFLSGDRTYIIDEQKLDAVYKSIKTLYDRIELEIQATKAELSAKAAELLDASKENPVVKRTNNRRGYIFNFSSKEGNDWKVTLDEQNINPKDRTTFLKKSSKTSDYVRPPIIKIGEQAVRLREARDSLNKILNQSKQEGVFELIKGIHELSDEFGAYKSNSLTIKDYSSSNDTDNNLSSEYMTFNDAVLRFDYLRDKEEWYLFSTNAEGKTTEVRLATIKEYVKTVRAEIFLRRKNSLERMLNDTCGSIRSSYDFSTDASRITAGKRQIEIPNGGRYTLEKVDNQIDRKFCLTLGDKKFYIQFRNAEIAVTEVSNSNFAVRRGLPNSSPITSNISGTINQDSSFDSVKWIEDLVTQELCVRQIEVSDSFRAIIPEAELLRKNNCWNLQDTAPEGEYSALEIEEDSQKRILRFDKKTAGVVVREGEEFSLKLSDYRDAIAIQKDIVVRIRKLHKEKFATLKKIFEELAPNYKQGEKPASESKIGQLGFTNFGQNIFGISEDVEGNGILTPTREIQFFFDDDKTAIYRGRFSQDVSGKSHKPQLQTGSDIDALIQKYGTMLRTHKELLKKQILENHQAIIAAKDQHYIDSNNFGKITKLDNGIVYRKEAFAIDLGSSASGRFDSSKIKIATYDIAKRTIGGFSDNLQLLKEFISRQEEILRQAETNKVQKIFFDLLRGEEGVYNPLSPGWQSRKIKFEITGEDRKVTIDDKEYVFKLNGKDDIEQLKEVTQEVTARMLEIERNAVAREVTAALDKVSEDEVLRVSKDEQKTRSKYFCENLESEATNDSPRRGTQSHEVVVAGSPRKEMPQERKKNDRFIGSRANKKGFRFDRIVDYNSSANVVKAVNFGDYNQVALPPSQQNWQNVSSSLICDLNASRQFLAEVENEIRELQKRKAATENLRRFNGNTSRFEINGKNYGISRDGYLLPIKKKVPEVEGEKETWLVGNMLPASEIEDLCNILLAGKVAKVIQNNQRILAGRKHVKKWTIDAAADLEEGKSFVQDGGKFGFKIQVRGENGDKVALKILRANGYTDVLSDTSDQLPYSSGLDYVLQQQNLILREMALELEEITRVKQQIADIFGEVFDSEDKNGAIRNVSVSSFAKTKDGYIAQSGENKIWPPAVEDENDLEVLQKKLSQLSSLVEEEKKAQFQEICRRFDTIKSPENLIYLPDDLRINGAREEFEFLLYENDEEKEGRFSCSAKAVEVQTIDGVKSKRLADILENNEMMDEVLQQIQAEREKDFNENAEAVKELLRSISAEIFAYEGSMDFPGKGRVIQDEDGVIALERDGKICSLKDEDLEKDNGDKYVSLREILEGIVSDLEAAKLQEVKEIEGLKKKIFGRKESAKVSGQQIKKSNYDPSGKKYYELQEMGAILAQVNGISGAEKRVVTGRAQAVLDQKTSNLIEAKKASDEIGRSECIIRYVVEHIEGVEGKGGTVDQEIKNKVTVLPPASFDDTASGIAEYNKSQFQTALKAAIAYIKKEDLSADLDAYLEERGHLKQDEFIQVVRTTLSDAAEGKEGNVRRNIVSKASPASSRNTSVQGTPFTVRGGVPNSPATSVVTLGGISLGGISLGGAFGTPVKGGGGRGINE